MTAADWENPAVRTRLVAEHAQKGGWVLLEEPLVVNANLCVAEGPVQVDDQGVSVKGRTPNTSCPVHGVYEAMSWPSKISWLAQPPRIDGDWTVQPQDSIGLFPCLFIRTVRIAGYCCCCFPFGW